ncbi:DUF4902 domain-containing protein [Roseateles sp. DC23W]|uniref:DUF4902 domain-containing protein n=1 Tax=Pelomonas dachongensis TaxID=3299029 RepID=A0ABW7EK55_9BURK
MRTSTDFVQVDVQDLVGLRSGMYHRLTMMSDAIDRDRLTGKTVWAGPNQAVLFWSWTIAPEGWAVLSDSLAIRSNLLFVEAQRVLAGPQQLLMINQLVNQLPWQAQVTGHVDRLGLGRGQGTARAGLAAGRMASVESRRAVVL